MATSSRITLLLALLSIIVSSSFAGDGEEEAKTGFKVTYDGRSLLFNGERKLLFSGAIHYPRVTIEMWDSILDMARYGGLNTVETYVFWVSHEPEPGKYYFEGNYDIIKYLKKVQEKGMYVFLRIGPFIQGEWNHGGFPYWMRTIPNITFRSDNEPFKEQMEKYVRWITKMMKDENMFAPQGGPIIAAQIENEYNHVQLAYREKGDSYVKWAANLVTGLNLDIPWVMCKQNDAPDSVINACNGRHCADTFPGPNKPNKPFIWTENWTAQYRVFGDPPSQRAAEDIAFSVIRFFAKNGSLLNYYMYHGGTNFGRTSSAFTTTRYYDEAPIDEYGLPKDPKWSHLRDAHRTIALSKKPLLEGASAVKKINQNLEVIVWEKPGSACAAFLTNNHSSHATTINFKGQDYYLPPHSISVLPDCKTVTYNTNMIASQHNTRNYVRSEVANNHEWEVYTEKIITAKEVPADSKTPKELFDLLKDKSDYAWYTTGLELYPEDLPMKRNIYPVLRMMSLGHGALVFANGEFLGAGHGSHEEQTFGFQHPLNLTVGMNYISILGYIVGYPDSGAYMEHRFAGPKSITVLGLNTGTIDLTVNGWGHQVSIEGEMKSIFTEEGSKQFAWKKASGTGEPMSWYKTTFKTPERRAPVIIRMTGMGKGQIWVNGKSIGRYWVNYLSPLGSPTQSDYHIPRAFLNEKDNLLVIQEEDKVSLDKVEIMIVDRDTICSFITDRHPPNVNQFEVKGRIFRAISDKLGPAAQLKCPNFKKVVAVEFASFGNPTGSCGDYELGKCDSVATKKVVEQYCMGKTNCTIPIDPKLFPVSGPDCLPDESRALAIQVRCAV